MISADVKGRAPLAVLVLIAAVHPVSRFASLVPAIGAMGVAEAVTGGLPDALAWALSSGDWSAAAPAVLATAANLVSAATVLLAAACLAEPGHLTATALAVASGIGAMISLAHGLDPAPMVSAVAALANAAVIFRKGVAYAQPRNR